MINFIFKALFSDWTQIYSGIIAALILDSLDFFLAASETPDLRLWFSRQFAQLLSIIPILMLIN